MKAWSANDTNAPDRDAVNDARAELIEALRDHLGARFQGGFIPTPFARERYPDFLSTQATSQEAYISMVQQSEVAIASTGLYGSVPHKVAEYLAASRPIVSEPINFATTASLEEGQHLLTYRSTEECLGHVESLLSDFKHRANMRQANHAQWLEEANPAAVVWRLLCRL